MSSSSKTPRAAVPEPTCEFCRSTREEHTVAEREGAIHHEFSADGNFKALPEKKPPAAPSPSAPKPGTAYQPGVDPILRFVLVDAGIITAEQLEVAEKTLQSTGLLMTEPPRIVDLPAGTGG